MREIIVSQEKAPAIDAWRTEMNTIFLSFTLGATRDGIFHVIKHLLKRSDDGSFRNLDIRCAIWNWGLFDLYVAVQDDFFDPDDSVIFAIREPDEDFIDDLAWEIEQNFPSVGHDIITRLRRTPITLH